MKTPYSEYVYTKLARRIIKGEFTKEEDVFEYLKKSEPDADERSVNWTGCLVTSEAAALCGNATHLFCHKNLFDWLISHAKDIEINKEWIINFFQVRLLPKVTYVPIILHVSGGGSPSCFYMVDDAQLIILIVNGNNGTRNFYCIPDNIPNTYDHSWTTDESWGKILQCAMFIKGLAIYSACCENIIIDGVPADLKHAPRFNENCSKYIRTHEDIAEGDIRTISPHFRNGHFRLLVSEKFTKKKGQVVFVHECFVKGKAKTAEGIA